MAYFRFPRNSFGISATPRQKLLLATGNMVAVRALALISPGTNHRKTLHSTGCLSHIFEIVD